MILYNSLFIVNIKNIFLIQGNNIVYLNLFRYLSYYKSLLKITYQTS